MLIADQRDFFHKMLSGNYFKFEVDTLFDVSLTTHDKIIHYLVALILAEGPEYLLDSPCLESKASNSPKGSAFSGAANGTTFVFTFVKYTLLYLFYLLALRRRSKAGGFSGQTDFVLINSAGGMDRLASIVGELFAHKRYRMLYLVTSHFRKLVKRNRNQPGQEFIEPKIPRRNALKDGLDFLNTGGNDFFYHIFNQLPFHSRRKRLWIALKILRYLYSMIIYHHWAKDMADRLHGEHEKAVFVFDIDEASKELMLADALNRKGAITLLLQHGILIQTNRYIPTCRWMACASERERRALMSIGIEKRRLFVVGQSLQTLKDSINSRGVMSSRYPRLILASNGSGWLQNCYLDMLKQSSLLKCPPGAYIRFHPAFCEKDKRRWTGIDGIRVSNGNESLKQSLTQSDMVITFSFDALVTSIRQGCPTICCIPEENYIPDWHSFLYDILGVRVAQNATDLDKFLADKVFVNNRPNCLSPSDAAKLDYAFGSPDTIKNIAALLEQLQQYHSGIANDLNEH